MTSISKLIVGGFKSISERTEIPIAPLTFLFGPNSAGKSSVLEAMDALRRRLNEALFLHSSDFLAVKEYLKRVIAHEPAAGFDPQAHQIGGVSSEGITSRKAINLGIEIEEFSAVELTFWNHRDEASNAAGGVFLALDGAQVSIELTEENSQERAASEIIVNGQTFIRNLSSTYAGRNGMAHIAFSQTNVEGEDWPIDTYELGALVIETSNPYWDSVDIEAANEVLHYSSQEFVETRGFKVKLAELKRLIEGAQSPLMRQLIQANGSELVIRTHAQAMRAEPWSSEGHPSFVQRGYIMRQWRINGLAVTEQDEAEYRSAIALVDWIITATNLLTCEIVESAGTLLNRSVVSGDRRVLTEGDVTVRSDDPTLTGSTLRDYALALGEQSIASKLPNDGTSNGSDFINEILRKDLFVELGYQVTPAVWKIETTAMLYPGIVADGVSCSVLKVQLFLQDTSGRLLKFSEVGSGISYVLPVLASLSTAKMSWISQPELHLHPGAQCELGNSIIRAFNAGRFCAIETHSEHLLLRVLRRIRETTRGINMDPELKCSPEAVSVLCFERQSDGSTRIRQMRVTRQGDFSDRWPNGFFEERGRELFDE